MGMSADGMAITPYLHSWAYDQTKNTKKNGYLAFFNGKKTEIRADTSYEAQKLAAHYFRTKKTSAVTVMLAEKEDQEVVHTA